MEIAFALLVIIVPFHLITIRGLFILILWHMISFHLKVAVLGARLGDPRKADLEAYEGHLEDFEQKFANDTVGMEEGNRRDLRKAEEEEF